MTTAISTVWENHPVLTLVCALLLWSLVSVMCTAAMCLLFPDRGVEVELGVEGAASTSTPTDFPPGPTPR